MSIAYEEWVRVERMRLEMAVAHGSDPWQGDHGRCHDSFLELTNENKKRRLLFAKGRKEPVGRARKVR